MQVPKGTGPGVRRSKRPLSTCHTRRKCSIETSQNSVCHFMSFSFQNSRSSLNTITLDFVEISFSVMTFFSDGTDNTCPVWRVRFLLEDLFPRLHIPSIPPPPRGVKWRMCHSYPQRDRKRRLNGAVCRIHRIKRMAPCRC